MLPDTTGRFGLFQVFDWDGSSGHPPLTSSQIASEAKYEDAVWGAFDPNSWLGTNPNVILSRYMVPVEDDNSVSGHDLSWWQANHPDWILYACKSDGTPTKDLAWSGAFFPDVPLDFSNPAVISYQMSVMIPYLKAHGYKALAADNTDLLNYLEGGNPNFGQSHTTSEYGCGTYDSSGNFHRVFSGPFDSSSDTAFVNAMVNWVKTVASDLHAQGLKLIINHPTYNAPTNLNEAAMLGATDAMLYERGFTDYGKYGTEAASLVSDAITWAQYAQSHHVAFMITDYLCSGWNGTEPWSGAACPTDPSQIPAPQVDWSLATYALVNDGGADVYISPQTGERLSYRPEYSTGYGAPCGGVTTLTSNVYERRFQGALVIVNASSGSASISLPSSHSYKDIEGRSVSNPLSVGPADGYVLLTSNGCS